MLMDYWKKYRLPVLLLLCFFAVTGFVSFLYGVSFLPCLYGFVLCAALLVLLIAARFPSYKRKMRELTEAKLLWEEDFPAAAPFSESCEEAIYQEAIQGLIKKRQEEKGLSEKMLQEARQYYALWSHQIKTPLAALRLCLQEEEPDRREMEQALFSAEQYVEMALQYQRMNGTTKDFVIAEYEIGRIVKKAVKKTAILFIYKGLRLEVGELSGTVISDEKWLIFILEQVLTNAVKYTKEGAVSIYQEGEALVVADTGIGILPEDLPRVFEWGYTGLNGRSDKHSTGIGLFLCKQMCEALGHKIRIASAPGQGTKVYLELGREEIGID